MPGACAICNQPSFLICGGCKLFHYCSKDHQRIHWKQAHKTECHPLYKLEENSKLGRYLTAARDIQKGEVIFQESPLVIGPKSVTTPHCLGCHMPCDPNEYHECDGCGFPLCSARCQVSDYHMDECRLMMKANFRASVDPATKGVSYFPIVPLRCLLLKKKNPEKYKRLINLQSHVDEKLDTPLFLVYRKNVVDFIRDRLGRTEFEEKDILTVTGILDINGFEIRGRNNAKLRGLYSLASMLAHDCTPNTRHNFLQPEMTIVIFATRNIQAGEAICATYTQTFWDTSSRRQHLKSVKCFECECERCSDPTELGTYAGAIRCMKCTTPSDFQNGPYVVPIEPLKFDSTWACESCGHQMSSKQIKAGNEDLKQELSRATIKTVQGLEGFLDKYGVYAAGVLHPKNHHVLQVKHALIQLIGNKPGYLYPGT